MKTKIQNALNQLEEKKKIKWLNKKTGKFLLMNEDRLVNVNMEIRGNKIINNIRQTNYNHSYARTKVKRLFSDFGLNSISRLAFVEEFQEGDEIRITDYTSGLNTGDIKQLPYDTIYYSINDSGIKCNGDTIGEDLMAEFRKTEPNQCIGSSSTILYAIFQIV